MPGTSEALSQYLLKRTDARMDSGIQCGQPGCHREKQRAALAFSEKRGPHREMRAVQTGFHELLPLMGT